MRYVSEKAFLDTIAGILAVGDDSASLPAQLNDFQLLEYVAVVEGLFEVTIHDRLGFVELPFADVCQTLNGAAVKAHVSRR